MVCTMIVVLYTVCSSCQVGQVQAQLKLERAARQDLEMHTEALVAQKTLTHQEILVLTQEVEKCEYSTCVLAYQIKLGSVPF